MYPISNETCLNPNARATGIARLISLSVGNPSVKAVTSKPFCLRYPPSNLESRPPDSIRQYFSPFGTWREMASPRASSRISTCSESSRSKYSLDTGRSNCNISCAGSPERLSKRCPGANRLTPQSRVRPSNMPLVRRIPTRPAGLSFILKQG